MKTIVLGFVVFATHLLANDQIIAKRFTVQVPTEAALEAWDYAFASYKSFIRALQQPQFKLLSGGETSELFYTFFRFNNTLLIACWPRHGPRFRQSSLSVSAADGTNAAVSQNNYGRLISLVATNVRTERDGVTYGRDEVPLYASTFNIAEHFEGTLTVDLRLWDKDRSKRAHLTESIVWK